MNNIRTYKSKIHPTFGIEHVCITDLSDGTYYGRFQGHFKVEEYYVEKGMILLTDMPENTKITTSISTTRIMKYFLSVIYFNISPSGIS